MLKGLKVLKSIISIHGVYHIVLKKEKKVCCIESKPNQFDFEFENPKNCLFPIDLLNELDVTKSIWANVWRERVRKANCKDEYQIKIWR